MCVRACVRACVLTFSSTFSLDTGTCSIAILQLKVKGIQRSGTEAIRTQNHPSKPKRELTNITNSQNQNLRTSACHLDRLLHAE